MTLSCPSAGWEPGDAWSSKSVVSHQHTLEAASILRLLRSLAATGSCRVVILVDSAVALHACAKGRSPSRGLSPILRKIAALCLMRFPLRTHTAEPGETALPGTSLSLSPSAFSFWRDLSQDERRWASNWARLCVCAGLLHSGLVLAGVFTVVPPRPSTPPLATPARDLSSGCSGLVSLGLPPWLCRAMFLQPRHATHKKRSFARSTVVLAEGRPV